MTRVRPSDPRDPRRWRPALRVPRVRTSGVLLTAAVALAVVLVPADDPRPSQRSAPVAAIASGPGAATGEIPATGSDSGAGGSTARPSTSTPASTTTSSTTTPPPPRRARLLFTGDVLVHLPVVRSAQRPDGGFDFVPMFDPVRSLVEAADVAVCHMEVPISADGTGISGYPRFLAPPEVAWGLKAVGFDACSTASNHSVDRGFDGLASTLEVFDQLGMAHTGTGRSAEEAFAPAWYDAGGIRVAHFSYTYGTNGLPVPADAPWSVRPLDPDQIEADAAQAKADGADLVVTSVHWGDEYVAEPSRAQREVAERITASGAVDLVVGHHAHVPQPAERVNGTWVLFGLGNFVSNQSAACCAAAAQDGVVATVEVLAQGPLDDPEVSVERVVFTPIRVDRANGHVVVPVGEALAGTAPRAGMGDAELRDSWHRTASVVARTPDPALVPSAGP